MTDYGTVPGARLPENRELADGDILYESETNMIIVAVKEGDLLVIHPGSLQQIFMMFNHLKQKPDEQISGLMQLEGYTHTGMLVVIHEEITEEKVDEIYGLLTKVETNARYGISILSEPEFLLRVLACSIKEIEELTFKDHRYIRETFLKKEEIRFRKY